jgi:hypothetical protein
LPSEHTRSHSSLAAGIAEEDEPDLTAEQEDYTVQNAAFKHSVARSTSKSGAWKKQQLQKTRDDAARAELLDAPEEHPRVASYQAVVEVSETSPSSARRSSVTSLGSSYHGGTDLPDPEVVHTDLAVALFELTGMGKVEMAQMQDKLVQKAREEREALRGELGDSPALVVSRRCLGVTDDSFRPPCPRKRCLEHLPRAAHHPSKSCPLHPSPPRRARQRR